MLFTRTVFRFTVLIALTSVTGMATNRCIAAEESAAKAKTPTKSVAKKPDSDRRTTKKNAKKIENTPPVYPGGVRLEAIGTLSASHIYITYGYLGTIANSFSGKAMSAGRAKKLFRESLRLCELSITALEQVKKKGVPSGDVQSLEETMEVYRLLKKQAEAGIEFAGEQNPENTKAFETARKASWTRIAKMLGLGK